MMISGDDQSVLIIGAGISGLSAGRLLHSYGRNVTIVDKARGVGGPMATRRRGQSVFDHGAQYFTAREGRFLDMVRHSIEDGVVQTWTREGGEPLYRGTDGMTSLPKRIASGLDVHTATRITRIEHTGAKWIAESERGSSFSAPVLLITSPIPQTLER